MNMDTNRPESLKWCSDGQWWLYKLIQNQYGQGVSEYAIPVGQIPELLELGAAAVCEDDQTFWRSSIPATDLPADWYEREEAEQYFAHLGLIPLLAAVDRLSAANN